MVKTETYSNKQIYEMAVNLMEAFPDKNINLPVKINFYLQKNIEDIVNKGKEIESNRLTIIKKYGTINEDNKNQYIISKEDAEKFSIEMDDLLNLQQEITTYMLDLDWFDNIELTSSQVSAILYMIKES